LLATKGPVVVEGKKLQVADPIVPALPVDVVDFMVIWDWSVFLNPDTSMEQ
jgi:hypothetical protein